MKKIPYTFGAPRPLQSCTALLAVLALAATPAMGDDTEKFQAADADASGTLDLTEFRTTLSPNAPEKQVLKRFDRADADGDQAVTLDEWLAYREDIEEDREDRERSIERFEQADLDDDGFLTYDEFIDASPGKQPLIVVRRKFLRADGDLDALVSLEEWLALRDDRPMGPKNLRKFDLADLDGDGNLTPDEFATTFPRKTPSKAIMRKFERLDDNDDGVLTRNEWNPGTGKRPV